MFHRERRRCRKFYFESNALYMKTIIRLGLEIRRYEVLNLSALEKEGMFRPKSGDTLKDRGTPLNLIGRRRHMS